MAEPAYTVRPLATLAAYDELEHRLAEVLGGAGPAIDITQPGVGVPANPPREWLAIVRAQAEVDLYFFARYVVSSTRDYVDEDSGDRVVCHPYVYETLRLVQHEIWGQVDVWSRDHWKSMSKSFLHPLWNAIRHPTHCVAIVSITKALAKGLLSQIQAEIEAGDTLPVLWPEIFPEDPKRVKPWSTDEGLKLLSCPARREYSFEAVGLEYKPVGKHFDRLYCDDLHDDRNVTTPEQIQKARQNFRYLSGVTTRKSKTTISGTWYGGEEDLLRYLILEQDVGELRLRKCVQPMSDDELMELDPHLRDRYLAVGGRPVFYLLEELEKKLREMGQLVYAEQMLLDFRRGIKTVFDENLFQFYTTPRYELAHKCTRYLLIDPQGKEGDKNDPSAFLVVGLGPDRNYYVLDAVKEPLSAVKRNRQIISLHRKWKPHYTLLEENLTDAAGAHLKETMNSPEVNYRFPIYSVTPHRQVKGGAGGAGSHKQKRLFDALDVPLSEMKVYLPSKLKNRSATGHERNRVEEILHEARKFPASSEDHYLACWSLLFADNNSYKVDGKPRDFKLRWPEAFPEDDYMGDPDFLDGIRQSLAAQSGPGLLLPQNPLRSLGRPA